MKVNATNKEQGDSLETSDRLKHSSADTGSGPLPDRSDSDLDSIWEGNAKLREAFSRLRAVRVPGKQKLTMQEAMNAASDQYESYRNWKNKGGKVGKLKALVEGKEVFKALGPPVFDSFSFNWPPLIDGVLQITTEHNREPVILYSLRLQDVPPELTVYDQVLPNGQHLVLTITRYVALAASAGASSLSSTTERFAINIAIQSQPSETKMIAKQAPLDLEKAGDKRSVSKGTAETRNYLPKLLSLSPLSSRGHQSALGFVYGLVVMVLLTCLLIQSKSLESLVKTIATLQTKTTGNREEVQTSNPAQLSAQAQNVSFKQALETKERSLESSQETASEDTASLNHVRTQLPKDRQRSTGWQLNGLKRVLVSHHAQFAIEKIGASESMKAEPFGSVTDERMARYRELMESLARYRELEERLAAISALQYIPVRVQKTEVTQKDQAEELRSLFARAFQASSRFKVLNDSDQSKAELVIGVRFERTPQATGLVFVDIRDSNGNFIWQDFTNCQKSQRDQPGETLMVDAGSFVSKLEQVVSLTK
jgi:hypothetical protein